MHDKWCHCERCRPPNKTIVAGIDYRYSKSGQYSQRGVAVGDTWYGVDGGINEAKKLYHKIIKYGKHNNNRSNH